MSNGYYPAPALAPAPKKGHGKLIAILASALGAILLAAAFAGSQALAYYKVTSAIPLVFSQTIHESRYDLKVPANWETKVDGDPSTPFRYTWVNYPDGQSASVITETGDHEMSFSAPDAQSVEYARDALKCTYSDTQSKDITWNGQSAKLATFQVNCTSDSPLWVNTGGDGIGYGGSIEVKDAPVGGVSWGGSTPALAKMAQKAALGMEVH